MPAVGIAHDVCADCLSTTGKLCSRCAPSVLPQLARNIGWLKLMGEAHAEQTRLQDEDADRAAIEKAKRRAARKAMRSGYRGLALSIRAA